MDDQTLHHFMEDLLPIVSLPALFFACAWVLGLIIAAFKQRATLRTQADLQNKILEKFSTAADFTAYLETDAGRRFFENNYVEPITPLSKIINSIKYGTLLTFVGFGFFVLMATSRTEDAAYILSIIGTTALTLGIGFLVSSAVSYRLAKSWGLISASGKPQVNQTVSTAP